MKSEIGAGTRGASMGIEALRIASLDAGSNFFKAFESVEVENVNELLFDGARHAYAKFIDGVMMMEERVCLELYETLFDGYFPLVLAGDHSTAYGTIAGIKKANPKKRLGVVWVDAHADINTPYTTQSGNLHGMSLAMACGLDNLECKVNNPRGETIENWDRIKNVGIQGPKINPEDIVYVAVRDVDKPENYLINKHNITLFDTDDVRRIGAKEVASEVLKALDHCDLIYLSFDVDSLDPRISTGTGTPVPNGLSVEEARILCAEIGRSPKLCAWELAEINPTLDTENKMAESAFEVVRATVESLTEQPAITS